MAIPYQKKSFDHKREGSRGHFGHGRQPRPPQEDKQSKLPVPPALNNIRIITLAGVEEIGRNMTVLEHNDDIFVFDAGFSSKDETTPGVDYILPNTKYLEERAQNIRAVFAMHSHTDHIGALPFIMPMFGKVPVFARLITAVLIKKQQETFPKLQGLDIRVIEKNQSVTIGSHTVHFFAVNSHLPDGMGVRIETESGDIVHTGILRLHHENGTILPDTEAEFKAFENNKVLCLLADSTNTEKPGFATTEKEVMQNIDAIMENTKGRIIFGAFPAQITRLLHIIDKAVLLNKKIVTEGRSMKRNIEIVEQLSMHKHDASHFIRPEDMHLYPASEIVILATGPEGDEYAELERAADGLHRHIIIEEGDTVVLSSSTISGYERNIQKLKDILSREGARIIHYTTSDINASSHAHRDEVAYMIRKIAPQYMIPISGCHYMLTVLGELARTLGIPESRIVIPQNGSVIDMAPDGSSIRMLREKAPNTKVLVDGMSVSDVQEVVIKDRQALANDGMFVIVSVLDTARGQLRKSPDIISRGFVYLKESQELLRESREIIKKTIEVRALKDGAALDVDDLKQEVVESISKYLLQKTQKRPVVIPVILTL
jgi:ribonuclease J